jgi:hypothetical protein
MKSVVARLQGKPFVLMAIITGLSVVVIGWNVFTIIWIDWEMAELVHQAEVVAELEEALVFLHQQELAGQRYLLSGALETLIQHKQFETLADFHLNQAHRFVSSKTELALITEIRNDRDVYEAIFAQMVLWQRRCC